MFVDVKKTLYKIIFFKKAQYFFKFVYKNKYIPSFRNPKTYNEKVNKRKLNPLNPLFSICSDKIKAKDYVAKSISKNIIIDNYYVGDQITFDRLKSIIFEKGDCLLKANHNSGPVYTLTTLSTDSDIKEACEDVNKQLAIDYGNEKNEIWYSRIKPQVLVEARLQPEKGETSLKDYKFHVFKQKDKTYKVILQVDFDREVNHNRSFYDSNLNWLPFSIKYPSIKTSLKEPKNYQEMLNIAKKLAEPFSYVRVDLYNIDGKIFFGEMTFAHESGCGEFSMYGHDLWMGKLWQYDPSY